MPTYPQETYNGHVARYKTDASGNVTGFIKPNSNADLAPVPVWAIDASGNPTGLMGPDTLTHATLGSNVITAGTGGRYATLQAAINYVLSLPQWSESAGAGTITLTKDARTVSGVGTAFLTAAIRKTHISTAASASRKFYPLEQSIRSNTAHTLAVPFQDTTATGEAYVLGSQVLHKILLVSDCSEDIVISSDGTAGGDAVHANIHIDINGHNFSGNIYHKIISGELIIVNNNTPEVAASNGGKISGSPTIANFTFDRVFRKAKDVIDWFVPDTFSGNLRLTSSHLVGNFDVIMPTTIGNAVIDSVIAESYQSNEGGSDASEPLSSLFGKNGATLRVANSTLIAGCYGSSTCIAAAITGWDAAASDLTSGHTIHFDNVAFILKKINGATEASNVAFLYLGVNDSDIYFNNCRFLLEGSPTVQSLWRFLRQDLSVASANRLYFNNCRLPDIRSVASLATISALKNCDSVKAITSASNAFSTNDLDALRGTSFTSTLTENITSIGSVAFAPDGTEITFTFTQGGSGGYTVGWAAAYKFHTAWSNTGNTTGKISSVSFIKSGSSWVQKSAANAWL